jgi:hypothetical protein
VEAVLEAALVETHVPEDKESVPGVLDAQATYPEEVGAADVATS